MARLYKCDVCGTVFVSKHEKEKNGWSGGLPQAQYFVSTKNEDETLVYNGETGDLCMFCIGKMAKALQPGYEVVPSERVKRIVAPRQKKDDAEKRNSE